MEFKLIKKDIRSNARAGIFNSSVGKIETPIFMPVGTQASVKGIDQKILKELMYDEGESLHEEEKDQKELLKES